MKKYVLLAITFTGMFGLNAQKWSTNEWANKEISAKADANGTVAQTEQTLAALDTLPGMYFDFAGGLPAGWTTTDVSGNGAWIYTTSGPQGQFSNTVGAINSTTRANGFMLLDGDFYNPGNPPSTNAMDSYFQSPVLDLTGVPYVLLRWQQAFRYCCNAADINMRIQVSGNGGLSFVDFDIRDNRPVNQASANPELKELNISAVAGNSSNVIIRYRVTGVSHYYWMVDDMALVEAAQNDIRLNRSYLDFYFKDSGYYTRIPVNQAGDISFRGAVFNNGSETQNNVKMNVTARKGANIVYTAESNNLALFTPLQNDTLVVAQPFVPDGIGNYQVSLNVVQDEVDQLPSNNSNPTPFTFSVTDTVFARDNGTTNSVRISPANYVGGEVPGARLVSVYEFVRADEITSLSVFVASNNNSIGSSFKAVLFRLTNQVELALESEIYDITGASSMGKWVTLPFNTDGLGEFVPEEGADYFAGIEITSGNATNNVFVAAEIATPQPIRTTYIFAAGAASPGWGFISAGQPLIRLNVKNQSSSIKNINAVNQFSLLPNPANEQTTLVFELSKASKIGLQVMDATGRVVALEHLGLKNKGTHQHELSLSKLAKGIYTVTIQSEEGSKTQKLIIN